MERKAVFAVFLIGFALVVAQDANYDCGDRLADGEVCRKGCDGANCKGGRSCCHWNCVGPPKATNDTQEKFAGVCASKSNTRWTHLSPEEQQQILEKIKNKN